MRMLTTLLFALAIALSSGMAQGKDSASGGGVQVKAEIPPENYSTITVIELADGVATNRGREVKEGHVWRGDIFFNEEGRAKLTVDAAVRAKSFKDGFGRRSVKITSDGKGGILLHLPKTSAKQDRWQLRELPLGLSAISADLVIDNKPAEALPVEMITPKLGTLQALKLNTPAWISAGDLTPDGMSILIAKQAPVFQDEFIDSWDRAARIQISTKGIELCTDALTSGLDPLIRQSEDPLVFDRTQYTQVFLFTEKGASAKFWPERLRRFKLRSDNGQISLTPGTLVYISATQMYTHDQVRLGEKSFVWFNNRSDAVASRTPFVDGKGAAYGMVVVDGGSGSVDYVVTKVPEDPWVFHVYDRNLGEQDRIAYAYR